MSVVPLFLQRNMLKVLKREKTMDAKKKMPPQLVAAMKSKMAGNKADPKKMPKKKTTKYKKK